MAVKVVQKPFQTLEHIFAKPKDPKAIYTTSEKSAAN